MKKRYYMILALITMLTGAGTVGVAQAGKAPTVSFEAGDTPGHFFTCSNTGNSKSFGCVPQLDAINTGGQKSLAVIAPGETVGFPTFGGEASTIHTAVSLLWPKGAPRMPFKTDIDFRHPAKNGVAKVKLTKPGLYVFICDIHVYMFAAVIVDNPKTKVNDAGNLLGTIGLDLGKQITLVNGITVPTYSDLAVRLLRTFFVVTDPTNWKDYQLASWTPKFPKVPVIVFDKDGNKIKAPNLDDVITLGTIDLTGELSNPATAGVGEVWVDTQFELTGNKSKPGTATAINAATWGITKKIALPETNMNHPHNMWTDRNHEVIYQTQWFDERLAVFNRNDGSFVREVITGPAPSHVMTRANNDVVHVALNGSNYVREFNTLANNNAFVIDIPMGTGGEDVFSATHPHGHWMSADGSKMVTPNENVNTSTVYNFAAAGIEATIKTGHTPIATGMMPDSSKYYVTNLLDNTISVIDMATNKVKKTINLIANYDPVGGGVVADPVSGKVFVGALPIQTPVSPDGTNMVTANTLTATITVVDTKPGSPNEDTVVAMLPCDPGCHGVNYGAKDGGGYYAYVASKFGNALIVVDPDPNNDGDPSDAEIVGRLLLAGTGTDDTVIGNKGMGGQGVLPLPLVYNGWVQQWVANCGTGDCTTWKGQLTADQKDPHIP